MTNYSRSSGTRKRQPKKVLSKTTFKYGGGKKLDWAKRNLVPKGLAKRLGWRKSVRLSPLAQEEQPQQLAARYSNREPSPTPTDDSEEEREREREELAKKQRAAPQHNTIPAQKDINYEDEINPYAEIGNIGAAANTNMAHKTPPNTKDNDLKMVPIDWANRKKLSPVLLSTPNSGEYVGPEFIKHRKRKRKVLNEIQSMPQVPPILLQKQMKQQLSSSEHIYDVLPQKMPEKLERLPRRNSLKKPKSNVAAIWETKMAAEQKQHSQRTMKLPPKIQSGKVKSIVANWGKK